MRIRLSGNRMICLQIRQHHLTATEYSVYPNIQPAISLQQCNIKSSSVDYGLLASLILRETTKDFDDTTVKPDQLKYV